MLFNLFWAYN